jgi:glycosyltransferase involved in cell wall biosynthesis
MKKKEKKNILLIVQNNSFPFDKRVKKEALSLVSNNYNVFVISPDSPSEPEKKLVYENIVVTRYKDNKSDGSVLGYLWEYSSSILKISLLAIRSVIKNKIQVVHVANPPDFFWPLFLILKIWGVKCIYDQHDLSPELFRVKFKNNLFYKLLVFNEKMTVKFADAIIAANTTFVKRLETKWNMSNKPHEVIFNGPETNFSSKLNTEIQKKFIGKRIALFVGLMSSDDNLEVIVEVANNLVYKQNIKDVMFILVGDGDSRAKIEKLTKSLNVYDYFHFTGLVTHEAVQEYLNIADVCLTPDLPNGLNENLTLIKVLEYMKAKKAFVGFDLAETKSLAQDSGIYSKDINEFADNLVHLLDNPNKATQMGEIGHKIIKDTYSWEHQEKKILSLYQKLLF